MYDIFSGNRKINPVYNMMEASPFLLREIVNLLHSANHPLVCLSPYDEIDTISIQIFQI